VAEIARTMLDPCNLFEFCSSFMVQKDISSRNYRLLFNADWNMSDLISWFTTLTTTYFHWSRLE